MTFESLVSKQFLKSHLDYVEFVEPDSKSSASQFVQEQAQLIDAMSVAQLKAIDALLTDQTTESNPWTFSQVDSATGNALLANVEGKQMSVNWEGSCHLSKEE